MLPTTIRGTVARYARAHQLLAPGPLIAAVSGGADSTALLLLLAELSERSGLVMYVAHFDHRTRPRASADEAGFVAELAARVGAPIRVGRAEKPAASEDAARRARYAFLRRAASEVGASAIATGHTRDDQAETVLLHLTRGSGIAGLAGMRPYSDGIVRPLLCIGREETLAVCAAAGILPRDDPSNRSLRFARNRIRHRVLPELALINPRAHLAIARIADAAASFTDTLREQAARERAASGPDGRIDLSLLPADAGLRSEVLATAWEAATGRRLGARQRAALLALCARADGSETLDLPGGRTVREYGRLAIHPGPGGAPQPEAGRPDGATRLLPGTPVRWNGWTFVVARSRPSAIGDYPIVASLAIGDDVAPRLVVRSRRPGDRVGRRKLQDVLVDAKVPVRVRASLPLVADGPRVLWLAGTDGSATAGPGRTSWWLGARPPAGGPNTLWPSYVPPVASTERARGAEKG
ncbi:MAG: tRNA lysidine(34) synthetase TilS [Chloroflexota bacterium]|nr:tRNA lysidine(34) synthetase TilS [Chloroflexota bacterium]